MSLPCMEATGWNMPQKIIHTSKVFKPCILLLRHLHACMHACMGIVQHHASMPGVSISASLHSGYRFCTLQSIHHFSSKHWQRLCFDVCHQGDAHDHCFCLVAPSKPVAPLHMLQAMRFVRTFATFLPAGGSAGSANRDDGSRMMLVWFGSLACHKMQIARKGPCLWSHERRRLTYARMSHVCVNMHTGAVGMGTLQETNLVEGYQVKSHLAKGGMHFPNAHESCLTLSS
eukprot:366400-Chlamydomonas_euryale.AAC.10